MSDTEDRTHGGTYTDVERVEKVIDQMPHLGYGDHYVAAVQAACDALAAIASVGMGTEQALRALQTRLQNPKRAVDPGAIRVIRVRRQPDWRERMHPLDWLLWVKKRDRRSAKLNAQILASRKSCRLIVASELWREPRVVSNFYRRMWENRVNPQEY